MCNLPIFHNFVIATSTISVAIVVCAKEQENQNCNCLFFFATEQLSSVILQLQLLFNCICNYNSCCNMDYTLVATTGYHCKLQTRVDTPHMGRARVQNIFSLSHTCTHPHHIRGPGSSSTSFHFIINPLLWQR